MNAIMEEARAERNGQTGPRGNLERLLQSIAFCIAVAMSLYHVWALGFVVLDTWKFVAAHILFATVLVFLYVPVSVRPFWRIVDIIAVLLALIVYGYIYWDHQALLLRAGAFPTRPDVVFGTISIILTLEATRRLIGISLPLVAIAALLYASFGNHFPGIFGHRGYSWDRLTSFVYSMDGIFSGALQVSATYIFLFILFGAFLAGTGGSDFFLRLSMAGVGGVRGGPAKIAVFASALFGTISGSAIANTAATGAVTIPLMKRTGYKPHFAAAVEAVASTGGQIMPPIMGAGAFIIADIVGVSYWSVAYAAAIPAILYFASVLIVVDLEAQKRGLRGLQPDERPSFAQVMREDGHLLIPLIVLVVALAVLLVSPIRAALYALATLLVVSFLRRHTWPTPSRLLRCLANGARGALEVATACACAGIVVAVLNLTGLGQTFAAIIMRASQGHVPIALILSMICCIILGMGLPTTPAYILAASVIAPGLVGLGVPILQAHLFVFFFACIAVITPPVALASFTAAGIAKAPPMLVGLTAVRMGIVAFIIPFLFVYHQELTGQGSWIAVLGALASALAGVFALAAAMQAYLFGPVGLMVRMMLLLAAGLLIIPGFVSDLIGLLLIAVAIAGSRVLRPSPGRAPPAASEIRLAPKEGEES